MYDLGKIHTIMWGSKAGCIGLDEKACLDLVCRLCSLLDEQHKDITIKERFEADVAKAKSEIPESFRRSFVKAAVEVESKSASKGLITDIPALLLMVPFFYFFFTEAGRGFLPRTPPNWLSSKWLLGFLILACLFGIGDVWDKISKIRNAPRRARDLEQLLL